MVLPEGFRVVFVGGREKGEAFRERASQRGVHLGVALSVTDMTGLYLLLAPDVVVLDGVGCPALAQEAHVHLSSAGARPLVVITEEAVAEDWSKVASKDTILLDLPQTHDELLETLAGITERMPSLFTMDTHLGADSEHPASPETHCG